MIRLMQSTDERAIRRLVMKYLKETYASGGEFPATLENAAAFTKYAIDGAAEGDPCVVAEEDGKIVAYCMARGIHMPGMTMRYKSIRTWGTFVLPEYRSKGYAVSLLVVAGRLAKWKGYERFIGTTVGTGYEAHALGVANRIPGMEVVGSVLVKDLTRKPHDTPPADEVGVLNE